MNENSFIESLEDDFDSDGLLFYRCYLCKRVVSKWDLEDNHECKCGHGKISPTNLTVWEKIVQMFKHPALWKWSDV